MKNMREQGWMFSQYGKIQLYPSWKLIINFPTRPATPETNGIHEILTETYVTQAATV